jgi:hypothetical protein
MKLKITDIPVIYINLDKHVDRKERLEYSLNDLGFKSVIRMPAYEDLNPKRGCAYSHALALELIKPPFIVLEDDCLPLKFLDNVEVPDDADAVYLGISSWGRMNSHSGPCVQWDRVDNYSNVVRVYNMLGAHAILYINSEYVDLCKRISYNGYLMSEHHDIGFAEVQKYYDIYAFDMPLFYQTSSHGTDKKLSTYQSVEFFTYDSKFWLPLGVKL